MVNWQAIHAYCGGGIPFAWKWWSLKIVLLCFLFTPSTCCKSGGLGRFISRPCLSIEHNGSQDLISKLFRETSLWEEVVVLKGLCWSKVGGCLFSCCAAPLQLVWLDVCLILAFWGLLIPLTPFSLHLVPLFFTELLQGLFCWLGWLAMFAL